MPESTRKRAGCLKSALVIGLNAAIAFVVLFAGTEIALRSFHPVETLPFQQLQALVDAELLPSRISLLPSQYVTDGLGVLVANPAFGGVNDDGYRTPGFDEPAGGRKTVLFLGDSFTWGLNAQPLEECFADQVRAAGYRVVNLGIPATGPVQYAAQAQHYLPRIRPDAVCVMLYPANDFRIEPRPRPGLRRAFTTDAGLLDAYFDDGTPVDFEHASAEYLTRMGSARSSWLLRAVLSTSTGITALQLAGAMPAQSARVMATQQAIAEIQDAAVLAGAQFLLFPLPVRPSSQNAVNNLAYVQQALKSFSPIMAGPFPEDCYAGESDEHFNNAGHARIAALVLDTLRARGMSPVQQPPPPRPGIESAANVPLDELQAALQLSPEICARWKDRLNQLKDSLAETLLTPPQDDGPLPGEVFASDCPVLPPATQEAGQTPAPRTLAVLREDFEAQLVERTPRGQAESYAAGCARLVSRCREDLGAMVAPDCAARVAQLSDRTLATVFTGHVPLQAQPLKLAEVLRRREQHLNAGDGGRIDWDDVSRILRLDESQAAAARSLLDKLNAGCAEVLSRKTATGDPAPLEVLRQNWPKGQAQAFSILADYQQKETDSVEGKHYDALIRQREADTREQFLALLRTEQHEAFRGLVLSSLLQIDTGLDIFAQAVRPAGAPGSADDRWDVLAQGLGIAPDKWAEARALVEDGQKALLDLLRQPVRDAAPPIDVMAGAALRAARIQGDAASIFQVLEAYASTHLDARDGKPFKELLDAEREQIRVRLRGLLSPGLAADTASLNTLDPLLIDTGAHLVDAAVRNRAQEMQDAWARRTGDIPWAEIEEALHLDPAAAQIARQAIASCKEEYAGILGRKTNDGGPAPLEMLAQRAAAGGDAAGLEQAFGTYVNTKRDAQEGKIYAELGAACAAKHREALLHRLGTEQAVLFEAAPNLLSIDTGVDYIGAAARALAARDSGGAAVDRRAGPGSWVAFRAMLNLRADQVEQAKEILNHHKDAVVKALSAKPQPSGPTPVEFLRDRTAKRDAKALEQYLDYAKSHVSSASGLAYTEDLQRLEAAAREAIKAMLDPAQQRRFDGLALGALSEIMTGYDPLAAALK